jgi:hypothetical protein
MIDKDMEVVADLLTRWRAFTGIKITLDSEEKYQQVKNYYQEMGKQAIFCNPSTEKESS